MKRIVTLCVSILLISCSKNPDPFSEIEFGKISKNQYVKLMKSEKVLIPDEKDTTYLRYFLNTNDKKFPIIVYINEERWLENYNFGKLRKIEFNIGPDTNENESDCRGCGPISKDDVDLIYNYYLEQYGKPDSLVEKNKYTYGGDKYKDRLQKALDEINHTNPQIDKTVPKSKRAIWMKNNFKLIIDIPHPTKDESKGGKFYYNMRNSEKGDVSITYEMKNYKEEFNRIFDSIRLSLKPNDIIDLHLKNPNWYTLNTNNSKLVIEIGQVFRKGKEEPKRVKGFKYDIVFTNSFDEELYRFKNRTFDIDNEQNYLEALAFIDLQMTFNVDYNNFSEQGEKLENLKNFIKSNKVKIRADIKKVLYEDNTILQ
jgi:hypothetical protein